ncbi:TadE/TadG family type IV pilus assembly protein [Stieleria marina]|uniref:TadE/TadG family type IV pilus assembly protein n=1 Tax=Stieleria marina TaxID=1930275 RepID=UPI003AF3F220
MSDRRVKERRGAAMVEFAVAATVLMMILFAMIEFVRLSIVAHTVEDASYAGARTAIIYGATTAEVQAAVENQLAIFDVNDADITVSPNPLSDDTGMVTVTVSAAMSDNSWITPTFFTGTVSGQTRMLAERSAEEMRSAAAAASGSSS